MKLSAIIAEYNPLHSGHLYHINMTKKTTDRLIVIMSGSFTQRGDIAISNKYIRATNAIKACADMVIELPTLYAVSPADKFAYGALKTLSVMDIETLSFGSESGDIKKLESTVDTLNEESDELKILIRDYLNKGYPMVKARAISLKELGLDINLTPNNTLGIEYINAIKKLNLNIKPQTILRSGNSYNDTSTIGEHLSATAIREAIYRGDYESVSKYLPYQVDCNLNIVDNLSRMILFKLNTMTANELESIYDVTEGLNNRIIKCLKFTNYSDFIVNLKTRRYTLARLKRILIMALLGIDKDFYDKALMCPPYVNVLAIRKSSRDLLSRIKCDNIITKPSDLNNIDCSIRPLINKDILSHKIFLIASGDNSGLNSMQVIS